MSKISNVFEETKSLQSSKSSSKSNTFENYEKIKTVGKGAFGTAVLYKRLSDNKEVVLKEVNMSELSSTERQMALNEVEVLSVLHHPNIISYLGSFESDGLLVIEMEYADGGTLAHYLAKASGPLPELEILHIFKQIVAAIQYMHEHNILHRDLKTVNIFLTNDQTVKVGDFGISKVMNTKSAANTVLGTPYYISPEMCEGKVYDEKSDIWALGCILYELACREKTFQGSNLPALVNKIMKGVYEPLPSIYSSGLKLLVSDLLQKDPTMRPPASVISHRVSKLYEKVKKQKGNNKRQQNYKSKKIRTVLYQLSGHGQSFQLVPLKLPPKVQIQSLAVGSTHNIVLTSDMLVYSWGEGKRGQLGHEGPPHWQDEPRIVDILVSKSISKIGAGNGFSMFVTDTGMVFSCGDGTSGALGHGNWNDVNTPKLIDKLMDIDIIDLSVGDNHAAFLTREGFVYITGTLVSGESVCSPQELELPKGYKAFSVTCGPNVTGVITTNRELLVYGNNDFNRLGLNFKLFTYKREVTHTEGLTLVKSLQKWKIDKVSFGRNHTAIVTDDGQVITMGSNNDSQLGHNSSGPAVTGLLSGRVVTMAKCGPTYTLIATIENAVYFWGTRFTQHILPPDILVALGPVFHEMHILLFQNTLSSTKYRVYKMLGHGHKAMAHLTCLCLCMGQEIAGNSRVSMSTIETFVVTNLEEVLVLHASKELIREGITVTLNSIYPLWHCIFLLVDTTAPYGKKKEPIEEKKDVKEDFDSLGPVPDWIKAELAKATHEWPGTLSFNIKS